MTMTKTDRRNRTMSKLMDQIFSPVDTVVWDLMSNATGIQRDDGIYTLAKDGTVELNPFDTMSMAIPAFSQLTPVDQVKSGDVLITSGKPVGWITDTKTTGGTKDKPAKTSLRALSFNGHETQFRPKTVKMLGMSGVTVVRSPFNFEGSGDGDSSPFGDMTAMLPLLLLGGNGTGSGIDTKTMMLMSMMGSGGGGGMGGMNPMMLMALMGDGDFLNR